MNASRVTRRMFVAGSATLFLTACGGSGDPGAKPPAISYDRDVCSRCGMMISDERYAAALVPAKGDPALFDDLGELVATVQKDGIADRRIWVHDAGTKKWVDGTKAFFVARPDRATPMGSGLVAFETREAANAAATELGIMPMTWEEVLTNWRFPA